MTTLQSIFEALKTSEKPVARSIHSGTHFKVLAMGFNKGMILTDHKAHVPTKLTVLSGKIVYKQGEREWNLSTYAEIDIPVDVTHSVIALEDSLCLLTQGYNP